MNKVKIFTVLVKDYDEAIEFYSQKIGFKVVEDKAFGGGRWVTLSLPESGDVTIALELAKNAEEQVLVGNQSGSFALMGLDTNDCVGDYERMKALGVTFQGEPQSGPWGTGVAFEDLYGNKIFMSEEP